MTPATATEVLHRALHKYANQTGTTALPKAPSATPRQSLAPNAQQNSNAAPQWKDRYGRTNAQLNNAGTGTLGAGVGNVASAVGNNVVAPALRTGINTFSGLATAGVGAAGTAAGGVGNVLSGAAYGVGAATDAAGLTNNAKGWVADNMWRHTNNAVHAGLKDMAGGVADTLSGGYYDYDGTFAGPEHPGTAVNQMRSGIRDELGRGSGFDRAFNTANAVGDFAATTAGLGAAGRGLNVAAKSLQGSQLAAPVLNTAAQTPVVGKPLAAAGNWLAGNAPAANMFQQTPAQYYRAAAGIGTGAPAVAGSALARLGPAAGRAGQLVDDAGRAVLGVGDDAANLASAVQAGVSPEGPAPAATEQPTQQGTPYVDAVTYADPAARQDLYNRALAPLTEAKTPEQKAEVEKTLVPQLTEQVKATAPPEQVKAVQAVAQNPESPQAQQAIAQGRSDFVTEQAGGDQSKLQDANFFGTAMGMWNDLGPTGQMAFMLGVPTALIGLLSGDGLTGILGGLGIGALGLGAGAMGMLGEGTQANMGRLMGDAASFFGAIPESARDSSMFAPTAQDATKQKITDAIMNAPAGQGAAIGQKMLDEERAKFDQLKNLHAVNPELAHSYLMGMHGDHTPKTREEAQALFNRLQQTYNETGQKDYLYNQALAAAQAKRDAATKNIPALVKNWLPAGTIPDDAGLEQMMQTNYGFKRGSDMNIAQKIVLKQAALKAARCWAGYEPVPGKEPYSENSCRPIGSKKKKSTGKERHHEKTKQGGAKG